MAGVGRVVVKVDSDKTDNDGETENEVESDVPDARDFTDDANEHFEHLTTFVAGLKNWGSDTRTNHLILSFDVPMDQKYLAMVITDNPGREMEIQVSVKVFDGFGVEGFDKDDD